MTAVRVIMFPFALLAFSVCLVAAPPPATQSDAPELTTRQKNLLLQLSDAEANIQAINKALVRTGYKVGVAYDRIDSNLKGNELMNRKGGGPVRWDEFYGKTARDYGSNKWGDKRPQQFDYIYRANDDQISRASQQIASMERDQAGLLARRRKHEDDQCRLWAILAFEQIKDHEIGLHPICRFALTPTGPDANVLRPLVLFLRTADRVAGDGLEGLKSNHPGTFRASGERMQAAYADLQKSLADALDADNLDSSHRKEGQTLKTACKELSEQCAVITDNYANALDRDQAKQDESKLKFREQLQTSLSIFAVAVGNLDDEVTTTAKKWKIGAAKGTPTPDVVAALVIKAEPVTPGTPKTTEANANDLLQVGSVWIKTTQDGKPTNIHSRLTVLERNGESIRARYELNPNNVRIISGTVKDEKFWWLARDVQAITGDTGADNTGIINGEQIDFEFRDGRSGRGGRFTLKLDK